jgi:hypothetical protein
VLKPVLVMEKTLWMNRSDLLSRHEVNSKEEAMNVWRLMVITCLSSSAALGVEAQVLIKASDLCPCELTIDVEKVGTIAQNGVLRQNLGRGEHLVEVVTTDKLAEQSITVKVENPQEQQVIKLAPRIVFARGTAAAYEGRI